MVLMAHYKQVQPLVQLVETQDMIYNPRDPRKPPSYLGVDSDMNDPDGTFSVISHEDISRIGYALIS